MAKIILRDRPDPLPQILQISGFVLVNSGSGLSAEDLIEDWERIDPEEFLREVSW